MWSYAELGEFATGFTIGEEAFRLAAVLDLPLCLFHALYFNAWLYLCCGEVDRALPLLERSVALCQDAGLSSFSWAAAALGYGYALTGRFAEALPLLEQAIQHAASMSVMFKQAMRVAWLSEALLRAGRMEEAGRHAARALELSRTHQERGHAAWSLRLLGEIAAHRDPPDIALAEAHYHQALALADELGMRPLQAHCHLGLGSLYAKLEQREQARAELSAAIALYRTMEMTFWLPQAEAALAQVEAQ